MSCEFRDEMNDWFYKGKWLIMIYDAESSECLGVCDNQEATAYQLGVSRNTIDRHMKEVGKKGYSLIKTKAYGRVRIELLDAFLDDIGAFLYQVIDDWEGYVDYVKIYTYDKPYKPKGSKREKWYYKGRIDEAPKECLNEIVKRMSFARGEFRIWITTPKKQKRKGRRFR